MELLLGCGHDRRKKLFVAGRQEWTDLHTLDMNPAVGPDTVWDLADLPLPFADDSAAEIHLYDVLEHTRAQGDWQGFFEEFSEFWRVLRPDGLLFAIVPLWSGVWAWGDPGHRRVIQAETLSFLDQSAYASELDGPQRTNRTDYRHWWRGDFVTEMAQPVSEHCLGFVLRAVKPARLPNV